MTTKNKQKVIIFESIEINEHVTLFVHEKYICIRNTKSGNDEVILKRETFDSIVQKVKESEE